MSKAAPNFAGEIAKAVIVTSIPLDELIADKHQVRRQFDDDALQQLADSIREHGVIQPIVVRPPADGEPSQVRPYEIIAGERRYRAARIAGLTMIPAVIRADLVGQDISVLQILENLQREDLSLPETAAGVAKLVEKIGNAEAAKQLGKSESWVSKHAGIVNLPDGIRTLVDDGKIESAEIALDLAKAVEIAPRHWRCEQVMRAAQEGTLTRKDMRSALESAKSYADAMAQQRDLLNDSSDDEDDDDQEHERDEETPEQLAARQRRQEEDARWEKERAARDKRVAKRKALIDALAAQYLPQLVHWLEGLGQLGLKLARAEDTGDFIGLDERFVEEGDNEAIFYPLLAAHGEDPIPKKIDDIRFELGLILTWSQLQTVMAALVGKPKASAQKPTKEGAGDGSVAAYLDARITLTSDDKDRIKAADLHADYVAHCKKTKQPALAFNDNAWGDAIEAAGIAKVRSNGIRYTGVQFASAK